MANVSVFNMAGNEVGKLELNDDVFAVEINEHLVHMAVVQQLANKRQGTQSAKTRSEVSGGGKKPWRQKGTGHARQGSTRAPQWTGGGVVFAPKPRDYSFKMNRKEMLSVLFLRQFVNCYFFFFSFSSSFLGGASPQGLQNLDSPTKH